MATEWIVMFDSMGVDGLVPWSDLQHESMVAALSGSSSHAGQHIVSSLIMRARANEQRNPEIWAYNTLDDIQQDSMMLSWQQSPQHMADLIRDNGTRLYGRVGPRPSVIV